MKKLKLSVAALLIAGMSYGQSITNEVTLSEFEVIEMINTIEDILEWQQQDMENGHTNMGSYEEKWGSNYWLTLMLEKLEEIASINAENWR